MKEIAVPFKKAPRWAFMKRRLIGSGDDVYLDRTYVIQTPLFGVLFHRIHRPDNQRDLHDHPWSFFSIVLRGWYEEDVPHECDEPNCLYALTTRRRTVRWFNFKRAEDRHSIRFVSRRPVWTLVFTGPKRRTWGFWIDSGTKFVKWTEYEKVEQA
jgi:hypothetical protein